MRREKGGVCIGCAGSRAGGGKSPGRGRGISAGFDMPRLRDDPVEKEKISVPIKQKACRIVRHAFCFIFRSDVLAKGLSQSTGAAGIIPGVPEPSPPAGSGNSAVKIKARGIAALSNFRIS